MSLERLGVGTYKTTCAADTEYFGELIAPCLEDGDVLIPVSYTHLDVYKRQVSTMDPVKLHWS